MNARRLANGEFFRTMSYMKPRMVPYLTGMIGMSVLSSCIAVAQAYTLKFIADAAAQKTAGPLVYGILLLLAVCVLLIALIPRFQYMYNRCAHQTARETRSALFQHRGHLPVRYFEKYHSSHMLTLLTSDIGTMNGLYTGRLRRLIYPIIYGTAAAVPMFVLDWRISSALVVLNFVSVAVNVRFAAPVRRASDRIQTSISTLNARLIDVLAGYSAIRLFQGERLVRSRFTAVNEESTRHRIERYRLTALLGSTNHMLGMASSIGLLTVGAFLAGRGFVSFGTLFAIIHLQGRLNSAFLEVAAYIPEMQTALAGSGRVFAMLGEPTEAECCRNAAAAADEEGREAIVLRDVSFSYDPGKKVLDGITLTAEQGQTIALVGPSGGGKSTIVKLLLGFYPPDGGAITIAGMPLGKSDMQELRRRIAYVPQDAYIFDGTLEENIRHGRPGASDEEVRAAAKAAFAHDFIVELPQGYRTHVGERGTKLSGGQRQRIAIARALLKDAPILLLDEATSSLDSESELMVQQALHGLMEGRTTLVIAHRLSTVENADMIYVIDEGKVVERGTHSELLVLGGLYERMSRLQHQKKTVAAS
ncbi:ABC transporter ATP-binding protein [Paenibacillus hamazuiensis]|uniref:ABC transporter ATP-binding protein n=1 Tax=Paenibacillus hamazuiensis TaxID=2936508 RepID=UPI00200FA8E5|nr:ABC transporter ATP-binding protein [Paenibacillus hamazuiensis]